MNRAVDILRWFLLTMLIAAWSIARLTLKTNPYSAGAWRPFAWPPPISIYNFSNKLREQSFGWDDYRISPRKTVCVHKRLVKDNLECMSGSRLSLIIFQPL